MDFIGQVFGATEDVLGTVQIDADRGMYMCEGSFRAREPVWDPTITIYPIVQTNILDIPNLLAEYSSNDASGYYQRQDQCRTDMDGNYLALMRIIYYVEWVFTYSLFYSDDLVLMRLSYEMHEALSWAFEQPGCTMGYYSRSHFEEEEEDEEAFYDSELDPLIHQLLTDRLKALIQNILETNIASEPVIGRLIQQGHLDHLVNHIFTETFGDIQLLENALLLFEHVFANDDNITPLNRHLGIFASYGGMLV